MRNLKIILFNILEFVAALCVILLKVPYLDLLVPYLSHQGNKLVAKRLSSGLICIKLINQLSMSLSFDALKDIRNSNTRSTALRKVFRYMSAIPDLASYKGKTIKTETNQMMYDLINNYRSNPNLKLIKVTEKGQYKAIQPVEKMALIRPGVFYNNIFSTDIIEFLIFIFRPETIYELELEVI
ncbi:MAG: hypothetical protein H6Q72_1444 [Firmicutes bacterium]|nr:hypothetical protein [Bacillota bacterium]